MLRRNFLKSLSLILLLPQLKVFGNNKKELKVGDRVKIISSYYNDMECLVKNDDNNIWIIDSESKNYNSYFKPFTFEIADTLDPNWRNGKFYWLKRYTAKDEFKFLKEGERLWTKRPECMLEKYEYQ